MSVQAITKDEWSKIEQHLLYPGATEYLQCDQYLLTLTVGVEKMKLYIALYVDGWMRGDLSREDCDIRRRFLRAVKGNLFGRMPTNGRSGKPYITKKYKKQGEFTYYIPMWRSFSSLRRHLIKNNSTIQRVSFEEGRSRVEILLAASKAQEESNGKQS